MPTKKSSAKKVTKKTSSTKPKTQSKTKATTKKASAVKKNAAPKKSTSKKQAARELVHADSETAFWMTDGMILSNLLELRDALATMDEAVFSHHVSKDKNDFADWVETVLCDPDCAAALRKTKKPNPAKTVVVRHLKVYSL